MASEIPHHGQPPCHGGEALCTDDPKNFSNLEGRSQLRADQTCVSRFATRYQCFCAGFGSTADYGFTAVYLRLYSRLFTAS